MNIKVCHSLNRQEHVNAIFYREELKALTGIFTQLVRDGDLPQRGSIVIVGDPLVREMNCYQLAVNLPYGECMIKMESGDLMPSHLVAHGAISEAAIYPQQESAFIAMPGNCEALAPGVYTVGQLSVLVVKDEAGWIIASLAGDYGKNWRQPTEAFLYGLGCVIGHFGQGNRTIEESMISLHHQMDSDVYRALGCKMVGMLRDENELVGKFASWRQQHYERHGPRNFFE